MPISMNRHIRNCLRLELKTIRPANASRRVAVTAGRHAYRLGWTRDELARWLQGAYGSVWVRETGLRPGMDFKDVAKTALDTYDAQERTNA